MEDKAGRGNVWRQVWMLVKRKTGPGQDLTMQQNSFTDKWGNGYGLCMVRAQGQGHQGLWGGGWVASQRRQNLECSVGIPGSFTHVPACQPPGG